MAEQDDATTLGNIELAIQAALMRARTVTVARVIAYRELPPNGSPVVDVQVAPKLLARPVDGQASEAEDIAVKRNVPLGFWQCGQFTVRAQATPGQFVILLVGDREVDTWMRGDGSTYRPSLPGVTHDINHAIALPWLSPESQQPMVSTSPTEMVISDRSGEVCSLMLNSATGDVTVKAAATVNVEAPIVTIGAAGAQAPIARIGDQVVIPAGSSAGTYPIVPGAAFGVTPSAHTVKG